MARRATKKGTGVSKAKNLPAAPDTMPKTGRGNPPKHTQFKKGVSGNKKGRPKGSKNLSTVLMDSGPRSGHGHDRRQAAQDQQASGNGYAARDQGRRRRSSLYCKLLDWVDEFERRAAAAKPAEFPFSAADREVLHASP